MILDDDMTFIGGFQCVQKTFVSMLRSVLLALEGDIF